MIRGLAVGRIDREFERLDEVGFFLRVNRHQAEAAGFLVRQFVAVLLLADLGIADRIDIRLVAKTLDELARVGQAVLRTVFMPISSGRHQRGYPAAIAGVQKDQEPSRCLSAPYWLSVVRC